MNTVIKAIVIFWIGVIPLGYAALVIGPMFAPPAAPYVDSDCDSTCMDELLAP